jgi:hypothetical protein
LFGYWDLEFDYYLRFGAWNLGFLRKSLSINSSLIKNQKYGRSDPNGLFDKLLSWKTLRKKAYAHPKTQGFPCS